MSKRKLLLADDSETVQKVVNLTFELEGIEVITFGDGDSAMAQFSSVAPDVVLADVNMPGMSGYDICQNIKTNEATKNTPVILLVGSFEPFDEEKAAQVGADDYLTKPFQSIRQLVSKVNELLSTETAETSDEEAENYNFDETLRIEENPYRESDFGDPGMDDEMIQTSQVGSAPIDETARFQTPADFQDDDSNAGKTQPLSAKDWQDIYSTEQTSESSEQTVYELADEPAETGSEKTREFTSEENDFEKSVETDVESTGEQISDEPVSETDEFHDSESQFGEFTSEEDLGIQPDDIDHFYREPDYEDEETVEMPQFSGETEPAQFTAESDKTGQTQFAEQEEIPETDESAENEETISIQAEPDFQTDAGTNFYEPEDEAESAEIETEQSQMSSPVPVLNFDEFDLLEISFPETLASSSTETISEPETREAETSVQEETAETGDVKSEVAQQLSGVNLSPEDIDAIAEKVVEKLSARLKE